MKKILSKIFTTLGLAMLIAGLALSTFPSKSYAQDLELIGKDIGLVIEPVNEKLFDLRNLNPGDTKSATITIKNDYKDSFNLYMRAERMGKAPEEGETDLFNILTITVNLRGEKIYEGHIKDFAISSISLGKFNPGSKEKLVATVNLPGLETGNEYQGKSVDVKWIFIAESITPPGGDDDDDKPIYKPIEVLEEQIPESKPEEPVEEPVEELEEPVEEPEEEPEDDVVDILEDEVPSDKPKIPKTGELPLQIFYISGSVLIILGIYLNPKNKK